MTYRGAWGEAALADGLMLLSTRRCDPEQQGPSYILRHRQAKLASALCREKLRPVEGKCLEHYRSPRGLSAGTLGIMMPALHTPLIADGGTEAHSASGHTASLCTAQDPYPGTLVPWSSCPCPLAIPGLKRLEWGGCKLKSPQGPSR